MQTLPYPKNYRPDIDGLRAVAVTFVVLFHAKLGFSGGYIGVDVFFVISGYLITKQLLEAYEAGRASILDFYARRAKRILPALTVVYLACLAIGAIILLPPDMHDLGRSLAASSVFVSNIFFYTESGYFDGPSYEKPLLHTWSLSVEEQFYIIWPILCFLFLFRAGKNPRMVFSLVAALVSISIAQYLLTTNRPAAFFLPISRAWELLVGALLILAPVNRSGRAGKQLISLIAVATLAASALLLNSKSNVPGLSAVPAVVSAAALIAVGPVTWMNRVLAFAPVQRLGLVSYSLYLWHWPLLAFSEYHLERTPDNTEAISIIAISLALAVMSWRYIEQPFRIHKLPSRRVVAITSMAIVLSFALGGMASKWTYRAMTDVARGAIEDSMHANPLVEKCHSQKPGPVNLSPDCRIGAISERPPDFLVIGDSHGDHFAPTLDLIGKRDGLTGFQATHGGCLPIFGITQMTNGAPIVECDQYRSDIQKLISVLPAGRIVVMAARWSFYVRTIGPNVDVPYFVADSTTSNNSVQATQENIERYLGKTIDHLTGMGHHVVLISQLPEYPFSRLNCYVRYAHRQSAGSLCGEDRSALSNLLLPADEILLRAAKDRPSVRIVSPADELCAKGRCSVSMNGVFLYRDLHHLNLRGSLQLATTFAGILRYRK